MTADWVGSERMKANRSTVLTMYGGNSEPPEQMPAERVKLMRTPFADYENSLREDLNRVLAGGGFDFDRDVTAVYVYRWGHGMLYPTPGSAFGMPQQVNGTWQRTNSARHKVRQPIGRIFFAGQDTEGTPSIESAFASGNRVAMELLSSATL